MQTNVEIGGYGDEERERVVPRGFKHTFLVSFDGLRGFAGVKPDVKNVEHRVCRTRG